MEKEIITMRINKMNYHALLNVCSKYDILNITKSNYQHQKLNVIRFLHGLLWRNKHGNKHDINVTIDTIIHEIPIHTQSVLVAGYHWVNEKRFNLEIEGILNKSNNFVLYYQKNNEQRKRLVSNENIIVFVNGQISLYNKNGNNVYYHVNNIYEHDNIISLSDAISFNTFVQRVYSCKYGEYEIEQYHETQVISVDEIIKYPCWYEHIVTKESYNEEEIIIKPESITVYRKINIDKFITTNEQKNFIMHHIGNNHDIIILKHTKILIMEHRSELTLQIYIMDVYRNKIRRYDVDNSIGEIYMSKIQTVYNDMYCLCIMVFMDSKSIQIVSVPTQECGILRSIRVPLPFANTDIKYIDMNKNRSKCCLTVLVNKTCGSLPKAIYMEILSYLFKDLVVFDQYNKWSMEIDQLIDQII